jgi:hypothetical protein
MTPEIGLRSVAVNVNGIKESLSKDLWNVFHDALEPPTSPP